MQNSENAWEALNNLLYLIDHSANDPDQVREYVRWAQEPMRVLNAATEGSQELRPRAEPDIARDETDS